jgi:hypothetical protein
VARDTAVEDAALEKRSPAFATYVGLALHESAFDWTSQPGRGQLGRPLPGLVIADDRQATLICFAWIRAMTKSPVHCEAPRNSDTDLRNHIHAASNVSRHGLTLHCQTAKSRRLAYGPVNRLFQAHTFRERHGCSVAQPPAHQAETAPNRRERPATPKPDSRHPKTRSRSNPA